MFCMALPGQLGELAPRDGAGSLLPPMAQQEGSAGMSQRLWHMPFFGPSADSTLRTGVVATLGATLNVCL